MCKSRFGSRAVGLIFVSAEALWIYSAVVEDQDQEILFLTISRGKGRKDGEGVLKGIKSTESEL